MTSPIYGIGGARGNPWMALGSGLRQIGRIAGATRREREEEERRKREAYARDMGLSGASSFEDAVRAGLVPPGDLGNVDFQGDVQFSQPSAVSIPARKPRMGENAQTGGAGFELRDAPPFMTGSGVVVNPAAAREEKVMNELMTRMMVNDVMPAGPSAPVPGTSEWEDWYRTQKRIDAEFVTPKPPGMGDDGKPVTQAQAIELLKEHLGGSWDPEAKAWTGPYAASDGTPVSMQRITEAAYEMSRTGAMPDFLKPVEPTAAGQPPMRYQTTPDIGTRQGPAALPAGGEIPAPGPTMRPTASGAMSRQPGPSPSPEPSYTTTTDVAGAGAGPPSAALPSELNVSGQGGGVSLFGEGELEEALKQLKSSPRFLALPEDAKRSLLKQSKYTDPMIDAILAQLGGM